MRQFYTAVLERQRDCIDSLETEPFEAGWASEAIFFVRVEEIAGERPRLTVRPQISADGVRWIDEGTPPVQITAAGDSFLRVSHFGGWLRLCGEIDGRDARFKVTIQLVLKE